MAGNVGGALIVKIIIEDKKLGKPVEDICKEFDVCKSSVYLVYSERNKLAQKNFHGCRIKTF